MKAKVGDTIVVESEKVAQPSRTGVIEEVVQEEPPRYQVRWQDGHRSVLAPTAGSARIDQKKQRARTKT